MGGGWQRSQVERYKKTPVVANTMHSIARGQRFPDHKNFHGGSGFGIGAVRLRLRADTFLRRRFWDRILTIPESRRKPVHHPGGR